MASTSISHSKVRARRLRRPLLAALALGVLGAPVAGAGCFGGFDPPSLVNALRVLAVVADKPYANPGDEVTFKMAYFDGYPGPDEGPRPVQITWLGGCFDPEGDQYYGCYEPLSEVLQSVASGGLPPDGLVAQGVGLDTFTLELPEDIVSRRPRPSTGPYYGLAYVFFAACAGTVRPVPPEAGGTAGSFPLGCFDPDGRRLGAESFVPGYTQVYVFDDGRTNDNPVASGMTLDGNELPEDFAAIPTVARCPISADDRRVGGCGAEDPTTACTSYDIEVVVGSDVAEIDVASEEQLTEVVWVDYFADQGDLDGSVKLVNDAVEGYLDDHEVAWLPPAEPGLATLWAVVHDARGGAAVVQRFVRVE